jgi:hypothetical protein
MNKNLAHISYHILVLVLSAGIALSLPRIFNILAKDLLSAWALIENERIFLVSLEICTATSIIILINYLRQGREARKLANLAATAGMTWEDSSAWHRRLKPKAAPETAQGTARDIMIMGSTGLRTFTVPEGDLHHDVRNCRKAKILLLNPMGEGAIARARSIPDPDITPEIIKEQIKESINFLKDLKAGQKDIRLKLYPGPPLLKLTIRGDRAYLRHYHIGHNVRTMPEYVFKNESIHGGLYLPLYRYFLAQWNNPDIPEYDLETDELVYYDRLGWETRRDRLT